MTDIPAKLLRCVAIRIDRTAMALAIALVGQFANSLPALAQVKLCTFPSGTIVRAQSTSDDCDDDVTDLPDDLTFSSGMNIGGTVHLGTGVNGLSTFDANVNLNGAATQITNAVINQGTFGGLLSAASGATVNMNGNRIQNVGTPTADTDAATKAYVDAQVSGGATINAEQDERLDEHDATLASHNTRITQTETKNIEQDTTLVQHGQTLDTHTTQIADLEGRVTINTQDIAALDSRVTGLESQLEEGFSRLDGRIDEAFEGAAMAMAMAAPAMPVDKDYAISINWGGFEGANGFAGTAQARVSENFVLHGGVGVGSSGTVGGRAGLTFAW